MNLKGVITATQPYPDTGEIYYLVDTNYRTVAQGWSQADFTGPLDLFEQRNPGRVFYTTGAGAASAAATDSAAMQAANDAMVDFRGDAMFFTPGSYTPLTAIVIDVPDARWLGRPVRHAGAASATITGGVASALAPTAAADRMEVAYLRFVPLTAATLWAVASGANGWHMHNFVYDSTGIAASTATIFAALAGSADNWMVEDFVFITDGAQGATFQLNGTALGQTYRNFVHYHLGGTIAISLLDVQGAGAAGIRVGPGDGQVGAGGVVTDLISMADLTGLNGVVVRNFFGSVGYAAANSLITVAGTTAEANLTNSYIATVLGGNGSTLYTA